MKITKELESLLSAYAPTENLMRRMSLSEVSQSWKDFNRMWAIII